MKFKLKFHNSLRPLKSKLEEALLKITNLENELQISRDELNKTRQVNELDFNLFKEFKA